MGALIVDYAIWFFFALLIGIATAWWVWGRISLTEGEAEAPADPAEPSAASPEAAAVPVTAPEAAAVPVTAPAPAVLEPATPAAEPAAEPDLPAEPVTAHREAAADDLMLIKGVGPQLNALLNRLGVTRFDQIAQWSPEDVQQMDARLGVFKGRIVRDDWIEQARLLGAGDIAGYTAKYGAPESK